MNLPTDAWRLSATGLASAIRQRQLSCREATASVLARIDQVNPRLNALAEVMRAAPLR